MRKVEFPASGLLLRGPQQLISRLGTQNRFLQWLAGTYFIPGFVLAASGTRTRSRTQTQAWQLGEHAPSCVTAVPKACPLKAFLLALSISQPEVVFSVYCSGRYSCIPIVKGGLYLLLHLLILILAGITWIFCSSTSLSRESLLISSLSEARVSGLARPRSRQGCIIAIWRLWQSVV